MLVDVSPSGAVLLGDQVCCDGFYNSYPFRVQTHFHQDHMGGFESSKGNQTIYMSEPTFALIDARYNADIPSRKNENIFPIDTPGKANLGPVSIEFFDNRHMLGSVQVSVELEDGYKVGYSGDFTWPLDPDQVMHVDELVLDATYGSPNSIRSSTLPETKERFRDLASKYIPNGPIHIQAHSGTLQHALTCLDELCDWPIITERDSLAIELKVYRKYGYSISNPVISIEEDREHARKVMVERKYIRVESLYERPITNPRVPTFLITARFRQENNPITELGDDIFSVSISDHADFEGTVAYVESTGAKKVMCDHSRSVYAPDLAIALNQRLGIETRVSSIKPCSKWGV